MSEVPLYLSHHGELVPALLPSEYDAHKIANADSGLGLMVQVLQMF